MKVILTHNNADFDAVASLLALHKIQPEAKPVLPKRINSNVARFLVLYASALPALHREDISRRVTIERAYVVDTENFEMVRGMNRETPVEIIDHHTPERDLPDHYHRIGDPTGANTTLLVEQIIQRVLPVSSLEATLMLLGIYEDTGRLTYKSTTPRDMHAAAWLLEREGDLDVVRQFLSHSMNDDQLALFKNLEHKAETLDVNGHTVVIASATLENRVPEMALVAGELKNLFDCSALFVLVQFRDDVQLIARSSVDDIDVGAVMRSFDGGGHKRAAAALVHNTPLADVVVQLHTILPEKSQPAVRVEELMSWGVQSIGVGVTIAEAAQKMLESGHEGYPVLDDDGHLRGLLTRRAVDRAMRHNMQHQAVMDIMEAGFFAVQPHESMEVLQQRMLASNWGQMPVINGDGAVVGIVTRTDLIKRWGQHPTDAYRREDMLLRLQAALPTRIWTLLKQICEAASEYNYGLFLVGGIVRDLLLGRPNLDIDLVVEGDAIHLGQVMQTKLGGTLRTHEQFNTAKWKPADDIDTIDFATSRAEFYEAPTVLPTVRRSSIKLDLHRRDFTINTLAIKLAPPPMGTLMDFYHGEQDLQEGIIRVLHSLSFVDDATRMLRAVRFEQRFDFTIEPRTLELIGSALDFLDRVSGDRLRNELNLILAEPDPLRDVQRLEALGILGAIHPDLRMNERVANDFETWQAVRQDPPWDLPADFEDWRLVAFSFLTTRNADVPSVAARLLIGKTQAEQLAAIQARYPAPEALPTPSSAAHWLDGGNHAVWLALWVLSETDIRETIVAYVSQWRYIKPTLNGHDLQQMGLKPGPDIGRVLRALRDAWLDGVIDDKQHERQFALDLIKLHS